MALWILWEQALKFAVEATGDDLTYQWLFNGLPLMDGGNVARTIQLSRRPVEVPMHLPFVNS
ncbi:MAG: hypothetical protein CR997_05700 [Acidobacteria bacterium]|nr:MAG: hypothetical protein CR997_05700 [Acidobacteriota bacterium]